MMLFKHRHGRKGKLAPSRPVVAQSSTPVFNRSIRLKFLASILKPVTLVTLPIGLVLYFGQPSLRTDYTWNGLENAPVYYQCDYLTFEGVYRFYPNAVRQDCPFIKFFPLKP